MSESRKVPFFGVVADPQSYLNIVYLLLAFPLGIAYFVFLVTGISVGASLIIIWVGVPILALVLAGSWAMCEFERILAVSLLKEDIPQTIRERSTVTDDQNLSSVERFVVGTWRRFKSHLSDRLTWTGILYLFVKFPVGVASFTIAVTLVSSTLALLTAPILYLVGDISIPAWGLDNSFAEMSIGRWDIDALWEALILTLIGIPLVFISLHLLNGAAFLSGRLAQVLLGKSH